MLLFPEMEASKKALLINDVVSGGDSLLVQMLELALL